MSCAGIDLSLTSPAICVFKGYEDFSWEACKFFYITDSSKRLITHDQFQGSILKPYQNQYERYRNISEWVINTLQGQGVVNVFIEDYSYGSTGRVFHIAENTGILKYTIWMNNVKFETVPPTVIKKTATGKGNANKELMQNAFIQETGLNLKCMLSLTEKQWNPSSDIIDSYYICKYGYLNYEKHSTQI